MLDLGWSELAIVAVVALFVIGPKELPRMLRTVGRYMGKVKAIAREFQDSIDDAVREAELDEVKKQIEQASKFDVQKSISDAVDPDRQLEKALDVNGDAAAADGAPTAKTAAAPKPAPTPGFPSSTAESAPPPPPAEAETEAAADPSKAGA